MAQALVTIDTDKISSGYLSHAWRCLLSGAEREVDFVLRYGRQFTIGAITEAETSLQLLLLTEAYERREVLGN